MDPNDPNAEGDRGLGKIALGVGAVGMFTCCGMANVAKWQFVAGVAAVGVAAVGGGGAYLVSACSSISSMSFAPDEIS